MGKSPMIACGPAPWCTNPQSAAQELTGHHHAFDRIVLHIARATENLHGISGDFHLADLISLDATKAVAVRPWIPQLVATRALP